MPAGQDAGSYSGVTNVLGPTLALLSPASGRAGGQNSSTRYVISQGGTLRINNSTQATNNRIGANATAELDGGNLVFANTTNSATENIDTLTLLPRA
jgi:hypothetical protein